MSKKMMRKAIVCLGDDWRFKTDGGSEYLYCDFHDGYECTVCCSRNKKDYTFFISVYSSEDKGDRERKPVKKDHTTYFFELEKIVNNLHTAAKLAKPDEYEPDDRVEFVWGIKSFYDLTGNDCSKYTMNDFDVCYDNENNHYVMSMETAYMFEKPEYAKDYAMEILKEFTRFMCENGLDTNYELDIYEIFTEGCSINDGYDSIEKLYAAFKLLVKGYCNQFDNENEFEQKNYG